MFFAITGHFSAAARPDMAQYQSDLNEHLGQRLIHVKLAGALRDPAGKETGFLAVLEADDFTAATAYLDASPYFRAGLYDRVDVAHFAVAVGAGQLG